MQSTQEDRARAPQLPPTMQAAVMRRFGDFDVLRLEEIETPAPRPGHVLVEVLAAGVNRLDHHLRGGSITRELPLPHVLGSDAAGVVAALGEGVSGFTIGERVLPSPGFALEEQDHGVRPLAAAPSFALPGMHVWGSYAQYMLVPAAFLVRDTTGLAPVEAAALPTVLATAVRSVKTVGGVESGQKVLIQAGASGSGSMQIQVAKVLGAGVAATVRGDARIDFVREAGADLVVNTRTSDLVEVVKAWTGGSGADVVIDNLGGRVLAQSIAAVRPRGTVVAFGFAAGAEVTFDVRALFFEEKRLLGSMAADPEDLAWGIDQVRHGRIRSLVDRTFPLAEAAEAHRHLAENQVEGNVVLLPWE